MLTPFRSARSAKVPRFPLVLFAWVLALLVSGSFSSSQARMDEPVPAPHFEGWPAVLVRFAAADDDRLREQIDRAWARRATKAQQKARGFPA